MKLNAFVIKNDYQYAFEKTTPNAAINRILYFREKLKKEVLTQILGREPTEADIDKVIVQANPEDTEGTVLYEGLAVGSIRTQKVPLESDPRNVFTYALRFEPTAYKLFNEP